MIYIGMSFQDSDCLPDGSILWLLIPPQSQKQEKRKVISIKKEQLMYVVLVSCLEHK